MYFLTYGNFLSRLVVGLLIVAIRSKGDHAQVTDENHFRDRDNCFSPHSLNFLVKTTSVTLHLTLYKNTDVNHAAPSYLITSNGSDSILFERRSDVSQPIQMKAAYQDVDHEAAMFVTCKMHTKPHFELDGTLFIDRIKYRILPKSRSFWRNWFLREKDAYNLFIAKEDLPHDVDIPAADHDTILKESMPEIPPPSRMHISRVRRNTGTVLNIDILVLLEYSVIKSWSARAGSIEQGIVDAKEYFAQVINTVNLRYKSIINSKYIYNIRLCGYILSQNANSSPWSESNAVIKNGKILTNATAVLTDLKDWVNTNTDNLPAHDHIMLFTDYDLIGPDNGFRFNYTTGFAFLESMCDVKGYSVSVVEDHGGFQSVGTAAHELGHSLGAPHDGLEVNNSCLGQDRFIMAPLSYNETKNNKFNPWYFSPCSIQAFERFADAAMADQQKAACLTGSISPQGVPDISGTEPGQLYPPDDQCRHQYGSSSYLCRGEGFGVNIICQYMFCYSPVIEKCVSLTAARGTTCGSKQWCISGKCTLNILAPSVDVTCPYGDQPYVRRTGGGVADCAVEVAASPRICYNNSAWSKQCCASCNAACTGSTGCECGDRDIGCISRDCHKYSEATRKGHCCYTCRNYAPNTESTTDTALTTQSTTVASPTTQSTTDAVPTTQSTTDAVPTTQSTPDATTTKPEAPTSTESALTTTPFGCRTELGRYLTLSCVEHIEINGDIACYDDAVYRACCQTCDRLKDKTLSACSWGDKSPASCYTVEKSMPKGAVCPKGLLTSMCCQTCAFILASVQVDLVTPPTSQATTLSFQWMHTLPVILLVLSYTHIMNILRRF